MRRIYAISISENDVYKYLNDIEGKDIQNTNYQLTNNDWKNTAKYHFNNDNYTYTQHNKWENIYSS